MRLQAHYSIIALRIWIFLIYLGGSIIPRSPRFSASSPALPPESQESFQSINIKTSNPVFRIMHSHYSDVGASYLLIWRWCCMTMFFSWMVSSRAVARDLRSEMD